MNFLNSSSQNLHETVNIRGRNDKTVKYSFRSQGCVRGFVPAAKLKNVLCSACFLLGQKFTHSKIIFYGFTLPDTISLNFDFDLKEAFFGAFRAFFGVRQSNSVQKARLSSASFPIGD